MCRLKTEKEYQSRFLSLTVFLETYQHDKQAEKSGVCHQSVHMFHASAFRYYFAAFIHCYTVLLHLTFPLV